MTTIKVSLKPLFLALARDLCVSIDDRLYLTRRIVHEGYPFVTKILPLFAKAVLRSIEHGRFVRPQELSCVSWKGRLPRLLRGYVLMIFDETGVLRQNPDPMGLWVIRQVCEYAYKLSLPFSDKDVEAATAGFIQTERDLSNQSIDWCFVNTMRKNVEKHYTFPKSHSDILRDFRPRRGPGTFAWDRGHMSTIALEPHLYKWSYYVTRTVPYRYRGVSGYFKPYPGCREQVSFANEDTSTVSEVLFVPKDSRGPRTIVREPMHALSLQLAFFDWFSKFLEDNTRERINFQEQKINRDLARRGSLTGEWATLDLKEASDRVHVGVCMEVFRNIPSVMYFLKRRTTHAVLPNGNAVKLNKLAGMGSGLTFTTMAFLIHTSITTHVATQLCRPYTAISKKVFVYGDDIVVPRTWASMASSALESIGLKVNTEKSYTSRYSFFRESCGGDYFHGQEVQPTRLKIPAGVKPSRDGASFACGTDEAIYGLNQHAIELSKAGLRHSAEYLYSLIERKYGKLPYGQDRATCLKRWTPYTSECTYDLTADGSYVKRELIVPVPRKRGSNRLDPSLYLASALRPSKWDVWRQFGFDATPKRNVEVTVPRCFSLRKRKRSTLSLIG